MILVTGASGFVGKHLVRALSARGADVRAVYHNSPPGAADVALPGVTWQKADLLDVYDVQECMEGIDEVYHCAAIVSFAPELHAAMLHFNPEATANLVNEALARGIRKMVYLSSVAALGRPEEQAQQITEEAQWEESRYNSAYGISKYLAEREVWRGIGEGLNAVIINPGIILGEGDWNKGSAGLFRIAWNEFPFYTNGTTSWVDVADVVAIMQLLMTADTEAERYIVSAGNYSYKDIFDKMATALGRKKPRIAAGKFLTGVVWRMIWLKSLVGKGRTITRETANNATARSLYDNSKFLRQFPEFAYQPVEHTVSRIAAAFLQAR